MFSIDCAFGLRKRDHHYDDRSSEDHYYSLRTFWFLTRYHWIRPVFLTIFIFGYFAPDSSSSIFFGVCVKICVVCWCFLSGSLWWLWIRTNLLCCYGGRLNWNATANDSLAVVVSSGFGLSYTKDVKNFWQEKRYLLNGKILDLFCTLVIFLWQLSTTDFYLLQKYCRYKLLFPGFRTSQLFCTDSNLVLNGHRNIK